MYKLTHLGKYAEKKIRKFQWTNTYGVARSLIATGLFLTLAFNDASSLVQPLGDQSSEMPATSEPALMSLSLFKLLNAELARWISLAILSLVIIGWRPRITGILHWYVAFSYAAGAMIIDGGDQVAEVLSLLLVPVTLMDGRKWHWQPAPAGFDAKETGSAFKALVLLSVFFVIRLQVAFIYFHAGVGKMSVDEWANGTSIFYWIQSPLFGTTQFLSDLLIPFFAEELVITTLTWGVMIFEVLLFLGIALSKKWRPVLLVAGILFHFSIIVLHGLVRFFFSMAGALVVFLGPKKGFKLELVKKLVNRSVGSEAPPAEISIQAVS